MASLDSDSLALLTEELRLLRTLAKEVDYALNSPGGSPLAVRSALELYETEMTKREFAEANVTHDAP